MIQTIGKDATTIKNYKDQAKQYLDNSGYDFNEYAVNDGVNEDDKPTLGFNLKFNSTNDSTTEVDRLKTWFVDNKDDFEWVRIAVHDCEHNTNGNLPCVLGDVWIMEDGVVIRGN
jgi:hypothetical protein